MLLPKPDSLNMVGRRRMTDPQRWQAIGQLDRGERQVDVSARFGVAQSVVSCLNQRYHQTGEVMERHGRGSKQATSRADDRYIINQALCSRPVVHQNYKG